MDDTPISDPIIERAVELWRRAIMRREKDNGDAFQSAFAEVVAERVIDKDTLLHATDRWAAAMVERLKFLRDHNGEDIPEADRKPPSYEGGWVDKVYRMPCSLTSDYNPDREMGDVAREVGLRELAFPWKSRVELYDDRVEESFGYYTGRRCHYPLPDGRWLITDLISGVNRYDRVEKTDMQKVIESVVNGNPLGLEVEG